MLSNRDNCLLEVKGSKLVITIELKDVSKALSASGKTYVIASTGGFIGVPGAAGVKLGLNLIESK